jgi:hypothetical protein
MKTILCLTDRTPESESILKYANEIALRSHAQLVLQPMLTDLGTEEAYSLSHNPDVIQIPDTNVLPEEGQTGANPTATSTYDLDDTAGNQALALGQLTSDLLILSMETWSDLLKENCPSPIAQLLAQTKCPVLVIPKGATYKLFNQLVLMASVAEEENIDLDFISLFSRLFDSKVIYFQVDPHPAACVASFSFLGDFRRKVRHNDVSFYTNDYPDRVDGIRCFVRNVKTDLVVMVRSTSAWQHCFDEHILYKMDWQKNVPLLALSVLHKVTAATTQADSEKAHEAGLASAVHD